MTFLYQKNFNKKIKLINNYFFIFNNSFFSISIFSKLHNENHIAIANAIKINFHKFLYLSKSSKANNPSLIFRTIIHIITHNTKFFIINHRSTENLFSLYNSLKLITRNNIYHVHKANTHPYIHIHFILINVNKDTTNAIHINFTLSFIFHIHANTLKLNQVKTLNKENMAPYDNNVHEKENLVHNSINHISFHNGIKKLTSKKIDIGKYV